METEYKVIGSHIMKRQALEREMGQDLYFLKCHDYIKIGISSECEKRMADLQVGNPYKLSLFAIIKLKGSLETECHRRLKHLFVRGEWFKHTPEIDELIMELGGAPETCKHCGEVFYR